VTSSLFASSIRPNKWGKTYSPAGVVFAVDGTVYPGAPAPPQPALNDGTGYWCGFSSGIVGGLANAQDGLWDSVCIGYPAVTVPMWPSVQAGRANLVSAMATYAANYKRANGSYDGLVIVLSGYSQGAMVTDQVFTLDLLAPTGTLHYLMPFVWRMYNFGDIFRTPGVAWGNVLAGLSQSVITDGVETGGIGGPMDLTVAQTNTPAPDGQPIVQSSTNQGDIYGSCPVGLTPWTSIAAPGETGYRFFEIIMKPSFVDVVEAALVLETPIKSIEEGINALKFFAEGSGSPHYQYFPQLDAVIGELLTIGNSLPHQNGY
jgi:hypothetical protein